jgi:hypothetical protein
MLRSVILAVSFSRFAPKQTTELSGGVNKL